MIKCELLRDADDAIIQTLTFNDGWVYQEKHNGDRRLIEKQGNTVQDYNRGGLIGKGLPPSVIAAIRNHPMYQFIIDVELVEQNIFLFDVLFYGADPLVGKPYSYREATYHAQFTGYNHIIPVKSARTPQEKIAMIDYLRKHRAEGFVAKELKAFYRQSMTSTQRWNYRYKFWKSLDAVVIGDSTKLVDGKLRDSVRLGLFDSRGVLHDICGSTKKSGFVLKSGDVCELKYLYGTGTLDVVQPTILRPRFDKAPQECTLDQIIVNKNWHTWRKV